MLVALLLLGACRQDDGPPPVDPTTSTTPTSATADTGSDACDDAPGWPEAQGYVRTWCLPCHSAEVDAANRQGAPVGVDFDTYAEVFAWRAGIEARATGADADMPPVPGATPDAVDRFTQWLACGAKGTDDVAGPCDTLRVAEAAPSAITTSGEADAFCAAGNQAAGDLEVHVDVDCLCDVQGDLTLHGGVLPLLTSVGGDLTLEAGRPELPALRHVAGSVGTGGSPDAVPLGGLETVGGDVLVTSGASTEVDLSGLLTVAGHLEVAGVATVERIDLSRLRTVGGALRLVDLDALNEVEGLVAVESIGRGPVDVGALPPGPDQGGIDVIALGQLEALDAFRLVTSLGGPVHIEGNPVLADVDGFTTLPSLPHPIRVRDNPALRALEGFDLLESCGDLEVVDNVALENVFGFVNLRQAGVVAVEGSPGLRSLAGLANLEEVAALRLIDLDVQDIPWFTQLHTIDGEWVVSNLPSLGRVTGFPSLAQVGGDARFRLNPQLLQLTGPGTLVQIDGTLSLDDVPDLQTVSLFQGLVSTGGDLRIVDTDLADLDDLSRCESVGGDLRITGNERLPSAEAEAFANRIDVDGDTLVGDNGP